ncbi:hypothetical protein CNMCM8980_001668 [Aspergillus fumigatiaffinis]|nr:hypothetical protein CNMCM8980_001668 [Aspergillus fumigatiaffinis]
MRPSYLFVIAGALLGNAAQSKELSYADSIHALAYGNVAASPVDSRGDVWLNITGFAVNELPYMQEAVGITSLDNARELQVIAGLVKTAASQQHWGDVVFLYNVFSMNAHPEFASIASPQMQAGLLDAVRDRNSNSGPDDRLIELYASTSSSSSLAEAFRALPDQYAKRQVTVGPSTVPATEPSASAVAKREANIDRNRIVCSAIHVAVASACIALLGRIRIDASWKSGGPRNICYSGCCISWSANATFQIENLYNASQSCYSACVNASGGVSCEAYSVDLHGTLVNQCLSNRPNGCG